MARHPFNRLLAWLIDWCCILLWVAVTAAVGVPLYLAGDLPHLSVAMLNVLAAIVVIVPVTVGLAAFENSSWQATPGKRVRRLRVESLDGDARIGFFRSLTRNALKIALPWTIGHSVVFAFAFTKLGHGVPAWLIALTALGYVLPIVYVVSLFVRVGRTPYDFLSRTGVALEPR